MTSYPYNSTGIGPHHEINSYLAILIITIFGSLLTLFIVRVIHSNTVIIISVDDARASGYLQ